MKWFIVLLIVPIIVNADFKSTKARYYNKLKQVNKRYLADLKRDRDIMIRDRKDTKEIEKEIDRIKTLLSPITGTYEVDYVNSGKRTYIITATRIQFNKKSYEYTYKDGVLKFTMLNGQSETWERDGNEWKVEHYNSIHNMRFKGTTKKIK